MIETEFCLKNIYHHRTNFLPSLMANFSPALLYYSLPASGGRHCCEGRRTRGSVSERVYKICTKNGEGNEEVGFSRFTTGTILMSEVFP